ncbi:MAG TPA: formate C-acetyltransferase/glycerol dehydratase family glycyl radical enzyme, partial [Tissierellia bacterium]|nr:formate C-acetyltransferase/glycerol dehydratase family glycyl radical enzyme [Tissierellia bacterium]
MPLSARIRQAKDSYIESKPAISYERARLFTESHQQTEGQSIPIRRAKAFKHTCENLIVTIFEGELIVGATGEFRKCGILTPEFSWTWVDREMENFDKRVQDPYEMSDDQRAYVRQEIFPYWQGQSLEEAFLAQVDPAVARVAVDTGIIDNDSKWRQAVGEITPDYQHLFSLGFGGILKEVDQQLSQLQPTKRDDRKKREFYQSVQLTSQGIITLAHRYADKAQAMAQSEADETRQQELLTIASVCRRVPEHPPASFREALQFIWFVQLGGILSENPLALNPGRFDQYMYPYYQADIDAGVETDESILELIECYWLKLSEWVWTISANTAEFFAGYNQFQNLTVGGKKRDGSDATNPLSLLALKATAELQTHQPGLSVRLHQDAPKEFLDAVTELVSLGTGFPAIHNDQAGYQMLINAGYAPEDARDWNNCGCVVPHYTNTFEWTSAVNVNFTAALEYALNQGRSRLSGDMIGLQEKDPRDFSNYQEVEQAFFRQFDRLIEIAVEVSLLAQKLHTELVPRPFLSSLNKDCLASGQDLVDGGAKYNLGPVLTGIGLAVTANSLEAIKQLVFEDKVVDMATMIDALDKNWEGYEELREACKNVAKYGNDIDSVDGIARLIANHYYKTVHGYVDYYGHPFNTAFMG